MASESKTAVAAALAGNTALAVLKAIIAALTGSSAMLAETFHSVADTGNQVLLFLGMRLASRPPDEEHPFGHGKNVYFWAFVVSIMLFTLGGGFSIREAVQKLVEPGAHAIGISAYVVLGGAFVFETLSLAVAVRSARAIAHDTPLLRFVRQTRDPTVATVLLEDTAALLSIVIAASGLALLAVAIVLALESYSLLIGERATAGREAAIRARLAADPAVEDVASLHTMHLGPDAVLVVTRVQFDRTLKTPQIEDAVRRLEDAVRAVLPGATRRMIVIEPARRQAPAEERAA
jgi:divalent metal cation (Fe/Co/Zn/Cd) transporter